MSTFKTYREESRTDYGRTYQDDEKVSPDHLKLGAILRIADASEAMAKNFTTLQANHDYWKARAVKAEGKLGTAQRSNTQLRACLRKAKRAS